jgi:hypothetical protein
MKNKLFRKATVKATALVVGSLMVFTGQAFAISSSGKEFSNADRLGNSKIIVAQDASTLLPAEDKAVISQAAGSSVTVVGDALTRARALAVSSKDPKTKKAAAAIASSLAQAFTTVGTAAAIANAAAVTEGDADAVANSLSQAESTIGDAVAISRSIAQSPEGNALATAVGQAATTIGNATSDVEAIATNS